MTFNALTYQNLVTQPSEAQARLFRQYPRDVNPDFDIVIVGPGFGGGVLADDLADKVGDSKRILILDAGSYIYPTHVFNLCRFPNASVAEKYKCKTFWQAGGEKAEHYIHEELQLNFGGRSIFWSGLIPTIQDWELRFFPDRVRTDLADGGLLKEAGKTMNESVTMGDTAQKIVKELRKCAPLADEFKIEETPRALHQPYLTAEGQPSSATMSNPPASSIRPSCSSTRWDWPQGYGSRTTAGCTSLSTTTWRI